ncbi:MAG: glycoside hydrolase family 15 protein [Chloroflexota bacterium]
MNNLNLASALDIYYQQIKTIILDKQHPITGLLPASTAVTVHGDYRDAWVRDNVYSILAVWALGLAYRNLDNDSGRGYELEQQTIKLMRGLLRAMMQQAAKVEQFKETQAPHDALHAKYDTETGGIVVGDDAWGHLQIDATSLFLLMLAQMISSGLNIIWTVDEVNFVQNLVYYIERAYRTPDYGIWERGGKMNQGDVELNASSLGMAKAALESLAGFDLFGANGSQASVLHVTPDNLAQADITLKSLLPRESSTKEVDAALLSIISFPAFAIDDPALIEQTRHEIIRKLQGQYGLKRFLRDGHQTVLEDASRLYYNPEELKQFEDIESEWPLFFTYLYLDALFQNDADQVSFYETRLESVLVTHGGQQLLPELYFVPAEAVEAEKSDPHSQIRHPNENIPLVWAQSLYLLGKLIRDGLLQPSDIDPLGRHRLKTPRDPVVQVALIAEDEGLQAELAIHGVTTETPSELLPFELRLPEEIAAVYQQVGRNRKLTLGGRPRRRLKSLSTSRLYRLRGQTVVCLSSFFIQRDFYLTFDMNFLVARFKSELAYIHRQWSQLGRPLVTILLTRSLIDAERDVFFALIQQIQSGIVDGIPVKSGRVRQLMTTASVERIDFLHDFSFADSQLATVTAHKPVLTQSDNHAPLENTAELGIEVENDPTTLAQRLEITTNLYEQIEILTTIVRLSGLSADLTLAGQSVSVQQLIDEVYEQAGRRRLWGVVRRAASLLGKVDVELDYAVSAILVRQKAIQVGRAYSAESLITHPLTTQALLEKINTFCRDDIRDRVLTQEVLIYLGLLIKAKPNLFADLRTVRISYLIMLLMGTLARERNVTQDEAYDQLMHLAPSAIQHRLQNVLAQYQEMGSVIHELELLHTRSTIMQLTWTPNLNEEDQTTPAEGWHVWRQHRGILDRVPSNFYVNTWRLFEHAHGLIIGDKFERRNRLDSTVILSAMTPGEQAFASMIDHLLNKIPAPEYRQLNLEALTVLSSFAEQNPALQIEDYLVVDVIIGHAVRLAYLHRFPEYESTYNEHKAKAWQSFYAGSPISAAEFLIKAFQYLLETDAEITAEADLVIV